MVAVPESHADLLSAPGTAVLTTVTPNGALQSTAVWFLAEDDGTITLSLRSVRKKLRNIQRDPRVTLFLLDTTNPGRTLEIRGTATAVPDPEFATRTKLGAHYGADLSALDPPGATRFAVTITPTTVNTFG